MQLFSAAYPKEPAGTLNSLGAFEARLLAVNPAARYSVLDDCRAVKLLRSRTVSVYTD
jgi:hypothetical protein